MIVRSLAGLAMVAAGQGQAKRAYRLAAARAQQVAIASIVVSPIEQAELTHALTLANQMLGETGATAAWAEGQTMTLEQAVAYALAGDEVAPTQTTYADPW
jgi:hypothetical protein